MLVHLNCIKHCSSIHDYLFIAVKTSLHYGGACMYKFCRFIPNFKYSMWLNLYLNVITFIFYCNTYVVAFIFQCVYVFQVSTSLALYGAIEIPSKICFCFDSSWHQHFHIWFRFSVTSALDQDGSFLHLQFDLWLVD